VGLTKADATLKAMILLGINGGLGNTDISELVHAAVNLDTGWIDYPRPKTGVARRFPLWDETVASSSRTAQLQNFRSMGTESF
jgi:hypothetical protein